MEKLLSKAFEIWHQPGRLTEHELYEELATRVEKLHQEQGLSDDTFGRAEALRRVVYLGITALAVQSEDPPKGENDPKWGDKKWRSYNILTLLLEPNATPQKVAPKVGLAFGGQFNKEKSRAFRELASVLSKGKKSLSDPTASRPPVGALEIDDPRYIERRADKELREPPNGETFIIRGPRQVGKTSLLYRATHQLQARYRVKVILVDFQNIDQSQLNSLDSLLYQLAESIMDHLGLDNSSLESMWQPSNLSAKKKIERFLDKYVLPMFDEPIILALDEVDRLLPIDFREDFFGMLRYWHNCRARSRHWRNLNLILVISTEPHLLIKDPHQSPFNVGLTLYLDDFSEEQVNRLNQLYGSPLPENDLLSLIKLLSGHPYLTSTALFMIKRGWLAWPDLEQIATLDKSPFADHLQHLHRLLDDQPDLKKAFKNIIHLEDSSDENAQFRLLKSGLIKKSEGDHYICRCDLYSRYFVKYL